MRPVGLRGTVLAAAQHAPSEGPSDCSSWAIAAGGPPPQVVASCEVLAAAADTFVGAGSGLRALIAGGYSQMLQQ